ncbi:DUF6816 family protein [Lyngbya aestuarii]|uniref:DUF6816 family protein n=1 Tax=Lyngbya aestuarii TaxID=118322 RepID=UPI00403E137F
MFLTNLWRKVREIWGFCLVIVLLFCGGEAQAGQLADRLAQFPLWESKPLVGSAEGDLIYPDWMAGTWKVTSTLVAQVAPLAPEIVTPGFESNRRYLNQGVSFTVRFQAVSQPIAPSGHSQQIAISGQFLPIKTQNSQFCEDSSCGESQVITPNVANINLTGVVADRAFNGLNIAKAYLGDRLIRAVKVDPNSPNRQITLLRKGRQLISVVTGRASETLSSDQFIATEVTHQIFRGTPQPYFNQVETTTAYRLRRSPSLAIEADQVTAVYLSPQDADYFQAVDKPVALYRYQLELLPVELTASFPPA